MVNKNKGRKILFYGIIILIFLSIIVLVNRDISFIELKSSAEYQRAQNYAELKTKDTKVENCEYVQFSAFFTRDLDGDDYAEKLLGTCKEINSTDVLYMDLNVLTNGYLKDGKITINGSNFDYSMTMVKDTVLKNNYISEDVRTIQLNTVNAGTQKLIMGDILPDIANNTGNYSNISTITLTGTHVSDDNVETKIEKTIELTIDWYGDVKTDLYISQPNVYYNYDNLTSQTISFSFRLNEENEELLLKENVATISIPELYGYSPNQVVCTNRSIESNYDEENKLLTIKRSSTIDDTGILTETLSRTNTYTIQVTYPEEAYAQISSYTTLEFPITGYYVGYNNPNKEFENPIKSNIDTGKVKVIFRETQTTGFIYKFDVALANKSYVVKPNYRYVMSKQELLNAYNNEEITDIGYTVRWYAYRGTQGEVTSIVMNETKSNEVYGDKFDQKVIQDYTNNTGIYFSGADSMLGDSGAISVYNDTTNELIKTFTKEDWNDYDAANPYVYEEPVTHIRIETSAANQNTTLTVNHIKQLDVEKIKTDFSKEEIKAVEKIYTYLTGTANIVNGNPGVTNDSDSAYYVSEKSDAKISLSTSKLNTQTTLTNQKIYIDTVTTQVGDSKWKNGEFLVEIPKEIVHMEIKSVTVNNENIEIVAHDLYKENEKYFIKILTENETLSTYRITINCNMTPNSRIASTEKAIILYAYNEYCDEYYNSVADIYDVNSNNKVSDEIGKTTTKMNLLSPTELITLETITNYNDNNEETLAPNVAEIEREYSKATINMEIINNYSNTVSGVDILGKIPFEGNTYIINGKSMNSKFTTIMQNTGIEIPKELKNIAVVYYSENENPTRELDVIENGWTLEKNVKDFSKIKTFLIDLQNFKIEGGTKYQFSYDISVFPNVDYNLTSYSTHAVFYEYNTENGNLELQTEPNKVGVRIVKKFDLELTKHKENFENLKVSGATYTIERPDEDGNFVKRILTTDINGIINMSELYVGLTYKVQELRAPENYSLSDEILEFTIIEEDEILILETSFDNIIWDRETKKLSIKVEDEPKYNISLIKTDNATGEPLRGITFMVDGRVYSTNRLGQVTFERLEQNKEYTLTEIQAPDYYILDEIKFTLVKDDNGNLKMISEDENFANATIENTETEDLIKVNLGLTNEKIPTYDLQIIKVEEDFKEENIENLKKLEGAKFILTSEDKKVPQEYTTDVNGEINISDLYRFVDGKYVTGYYTLQEIEAPNGYSNNAEEIRFRVRKNADEQLEIEIQNQEELETLKSVVVEENIIKIIIQDKPLFKLVKTDSETGAPLANVGFTIYEIDEEGKIIDFAKDVNNNYVGVLNEDDAYVIRTNESGIITVPLRNGTYRMVEVEFPEGYEENVADEFFVIDDGSEEEKEDDNEETENVLEINYIEDLVDLSKTVNEGNADKATNVKLMRTLDFEEDSSYKEPNSTSYGDLNGNGIVQGIKDELIDVNGCGFTPIGKDSSNSVFYGIFDGQGFEIRNIYVNITQNNYVDAALFSYVRKCKIMNLGLTGNIYGKTNSTSEYGSDCRAGGIVSSGSGIIINCYNKCNVTSICNVSSSSKWADSIAGGIVGNGYSFEIQSCYNVGNINSQNNGNKGNYIYSYAGGVLGYDNATPNIRNCFNIGTICSTNRGDAYAGGICGNKEVVKNSYNVGDVISTSTNNKSYVGAITISDDSNNNYYLNTITLTGNTKYISDIALSSDYMKSQEFVTKLGDEVWCIDATLNSGYPIFKDIDNNIMYINNIEDLVELSAMVNEGNNFAQKVVELSRTLDFNDDNSYNNPNDKSYGDINENGILEGIKSELTNESGSGFIPIGNNTCFSSIFEGNGYEIRNLYINISDKSSCSGVGLFANVQNAQIRNLGITGSINVTNKSVAVGGFVANLINSHIINCYNKSDINVNTINSYNAYVGGLVGTDGTGSKILNSYNTGSININNASQIGGIIGYLYGKVKNCYNSGDITVLGSNDGCGGIAGYFSGGGNAGNIIKSYNTANIISSGSYTGGILGNSYWAEGLKECYNTGNIYSIGGSATGGIAGYLYAYSGAENVYNSGTITMLTSRENSNCGGIIGIYNFAVQLLKNSYNTGDVINYSSNGYVGAIIGSNSPNTINYINGLNNYYLDNINIVGTNINDETSLQVSEEQMKTLEFFNTLNEDDEWYTFKNNYPKLKIMPINLKNIKNLNIVNQMKSYNITTEVAKNSEGLATGGSISGEFNEIFLEKGNVKFVENLKYNSNSTKSIEVTPENDYYIDKIFVNGEEIEFTIDENEKAFLPIEYFKEVKENKHITVQFEPKDNLIITKVDSNDSDLKLEDAKFKVEKNLMSSDFSDSSVLGKIQSNSTYKFEGSYSYKSNNAGISNSVANSYFPIDLRNYSGTVTLSLYAEVSSQANYDIGYATITQSTAVPAYNNSTGRFIYISGSVSSKKYTTTLTCGKMYYLHLGYRKDGSINSNDDYFVARWIELNVTDSTAYVYNLTTDENGQASLRLPNDRNIKITEIQAPLGYILNSEVKNVSIGDTEILELTYTNEKKTSNAIITKIDKTTNKPLPNVTFDIYNINSTQKICTKTTDANGQIKMWLPDGYYKAVEVSAPEGYVLEDERVSYFKTEGYDETVLTPTLEIDSIEDLVRFSNNVNSGTTYSGLLVTLNKTLDLNDTTSYENPDDTTTFGDYNGDGTTEGIKIELTKTTAGCGFKPIARSYSFAGIFDGKGNEIRNIYIKNTSSIYTGLFGYVSGGTIKNVGVTGVIKNNRTGTQTYTGGIAGLIANNSKILNCYNKATVEANNTYRLNVGGIVGRTNSSRIELCNNSGTINAVNSNTSNQNSYVCGITAYGYISKIENCYNTGNVTSNSTSTGYNMVTGIIGLIDNCDIINTYNTGNISSTGKGYGIAAGIVANIYSTGGKVINAYNTGNMDVNAVYNSYVAGIVGYAQNNGIVMNAYNTGNLVKSSTSTNTSYMGGIVGNASSMKFIENVYNIGDITSSTTTNLYKGGIVGYAYNSPVSKAYYTNTFNAMGYGVGETVKITLEELKTNEFLTVLNSERDGINWISDTNGYPTLDLANATNTYLNASSNITIDNIPKVHKITTKIAENSVGTTDGRTISGENKFAYELVNHNGTSTKDIVVDPDDGYEIEYITVNGTRIEFTTDAEGTAVLNKLTSIKEDKEIIVKFTKITKFNFVLTKTDKVRNEVMPGVKFTILEESGNIARDYFGNIVGQLETINGEEQYVVTTNEKGQIYLNLGIGKYKIIEVQTLEGYELDVEKEFEITSEHIEHEMLWTANIVTTHYPCKDYVIVTSDNGMLQASYGVSNTIPAENTANNQSIQLTSDKGLILKYNNKGKIEKAIQITGLQGGTQVYEDKSGNYIILGLGTQVEIPASQTVSGEVITLDYTGTATRTIMFKMNSDLKVIWAKAFDSFYPTNGVNNPIFEDKNGNYLFGIYGTINSDASIPAEDTVDNKVIDLSYTVENSNALLMKLNPEGKVIYAKKIGSAPIENFIEKENGGFVISDMGYRVIAELDSNGNLVKQFTGISGININNSRNRLVTADEGFIIAGTLNSEVTIPAENTVKNEEIKIQADDYPKMIIIKYNKDFKLEWFKLYANQSPQHILQTENGQYMLLTQGSNCLEINKLDSQGNILDKVKASNGNSYMYSDNSNTKIICQGNQFECYRFTEELAQVSLEITNQKVAKVTVHHYLEETGPEFGNEPVILAEDEVILGKEGDEFTTSPNMKIPEYTLLKDINGEYVIPENASGTFNLENQEIFYYYNKAPLEVIVHHYLDGTETKLLDDEHYYYQEGQSYKVEASEEILLTHNFVEVIGDVEKVITENEEISFYYRIKEYNINTEVEILLDSENKGGDISGETMAPFEIVEHGSDSKEDILITPYDGYKVSTIKLQSTDENGDVSETVIYGENAVESAEITYKKNLDGTVLLTKFNDMAADKKILVSFEPDEGRVIVHHYIENSAEKIYDDILIIDTVGNVVETKPVKVENYVVVKAPESTELTVTEQTQEHVYYYQRQYEVTTEIRNYQELDENEEWQDIIGGTVVIEGNVEKEEILKNKNSQKTITITPYEDFEIVEIAVNGVPQDFEEFIQEDGTVVIPKEFFKKVNEDKLLEVEFRRKSQVIVKFLEVDTEQVLAEDIIIPGYAGKEFETSRVNIPGYKSAEAGITDELGMIIEPNGQMGLEDITIIYWYEKAEDGILVKHIDKVLNKTLNAEGLEEITITENILSEEVIEGLAGEEKETLRSEFENYISSENLDATNGLNVGKDENSKTVTILESGVVEVIYWYEKEFKITTDVIEHEETDENGIAITVKGGSVLGEDEEPYETVLRAGDSTKEIKIVPDDGYRIKRVLVNGKEILVQDKLEVDGTLLLTKFTNIQEDKHIEVEFEMIPSTVVVKYVDKYTKECIAEDKVIHGVLGAEYGVTRLEVESYIPADPEPENIAGKMTEEPITVIFWYTKQFKITTDVKEVENVKGGEISGEDEAPYEIVSREGISTKQIIIKPEAGFMIKELTINDIPIEIKDLIKPDRSFELPMFEDIQEDKHIVVEFEKIPAKVILKYLEDGTNKVLSKELVIEGFVNEEYEAKAIEIEDYELLEDKLPNNIKGIMTEDNITVVFYYKKIEKVVEKPEVETPKPETPQEKPQEPPTDSTPEQPEQNQPPITWEPNIPNYKPNTNNKYNKVENVKTGDNILGVVVILMISATSLLLIIKLNKKK